MKESLVFEVFKQPLVK